MENDNPPVPKVKDLISFLSKLDPEMEITLDKDGWMLDDFPPSASMEEIIKKRGVFYVSKNCGLVINN